MIATTALLWSCQTEQIVADEVTSSKKKPLPDGIPSDGDDVYEFAKSRYTHNGKVITDTLQIMSMLSSARGLHIDETGNNKQIFITRQERESFDNTTENKSANRTVALDGDNYLHYFFEIKVTSPNTEIDILNYVNVVGPWLYYNQASFQVQRFYQTTGTPFGYESSENTTNLSEYMYNSNIGVENRNTDINVHNTTRYKRRVKFISEGGDIVSRDLASRSSLTLRAASTKTSKTFAGLSNFKIKRHESIKL